MTGWLPGADDDDDNEEAESEASDAAIAFEKLRQAIERRGAATVKELRVLRGGVEALFEQVEALNLKPDYSEDMGDLNEGLGAIEERLEALEGLPILKEGLDAFKHAGTELFRTSARELHDKAQRLDNAAFTLERITKNIEDRQTRYQHLAIAAGVGGVIGMLILLFLPRLMPFNADTYVAAAIMGEPRWIAGTHIMGAKNPQGWAAVLENAQLGSDNADVLARCRELVAKTKQVQKCTVKVMPDHE